MEFQTPLIPARLLRRYKRFFADMRLDDGQEVITHCPNTGPMTGISDIGMRCWLEPNDDPKKKLNFGWRLVDHENGHFTGVDTSVPNRVLREALLASAIPVLAEYNSVRAEFRYGENSRIDFLLSRDGLPDVYVEVKSVTLMREPGLAEFPDTVTTRGTKHLNELSKVAQAGHRAVSLFLVQRTDCTHFSIAADFDPAFAQAHRDAHTAGVETMILGCRVSPSGVEIAGPLPFAD